MKNIFRIFLVALLLAVPNAADGVNLRQISTDDGLSNSAVLSLCCDSDGLLWVGTCDGLNAYDGYAVYPARLMPEYSMLSGNIIESITESEPGVLWVQTNYGLNRIEAAKGVHDVFPKYQGQEKIRVAPDGTVFVLTENSDVAYYSASDKEFVRLLGVETPFADICDMIIHESAIRLFTTGGIVDYPVSADGRGGYSAGRRRMMAEMTLRCAFNDGDVTLAIDADGNVLEFRSLDCVPVTLHNIKAETARRGVVSDMLADNSGNIFIAFLTDGLIKLSKEFGKNYAVEDMGLNIGVFCLLKSASQNLVWVGTDCHGVYTFFDSSYTFQSVGFADLGNRISRPVRAVMLDDAGSLWLGTKGDGLLRVRDFDVRSGRSPDAGTLFSTANSALCDNSVYAFSRSSRPLLWIATDKGLNYYSYPDERIYPADTGGMPVELIHGVHEVDDTTLLMSTLGHGVFKARIAGSATRPSLTDIRRYTIDGGNFSSNYFFSLTTDSADAPVFSNRGFGAFRLEGDSLKSVISLKNSYDNKTINDVFAVVRDKGVLWLGTGHGLLKVTPDDDKLFVGSEKGFLNSTVHSMQKDDDGNLWISTNRGLIRFNPATEEAQVFDREYGITVNEFSDGASYHTGRSIIFGGVNGIVTVSKNPYQRPAEKYMPKITLVNLSIAGLSEPLSEYLTEGAGGRRLRLASNQNYFSLTFSAPDYINSANYVFMYSLDGRDWISNGANRTLTFTRLAYGANTLRVRYLNRDTGAQSAVYRLEIEITAPWYLSVGAKVAYLLAVLAIIYMIVRVYLLRQKEKQAQVLEKIERSHKEEVYESKLRFFTNITHEFCTPLTLIYGSCERILACQEADGHMRKYVSLIRSNTERLNSLIQDLIDFRRIETGHKDRKIRSVGVSEVGNDIYRSFTVIAEQNGVGFENDVQPGLSFNTDYKALLRIMSNLLSNAFKYTPAGGTVRLGMKETGGNLVIEVYNTGKGISSADRKKIFNRYSILDNVEKNATRGLSSRNGLGMAICSSLVELLDGEIEIESEVGRYALFRVTLPSLPCGRDTDEEPSVPDSAMMLPQVVDAPQSAACADAPVHEKGRSSILVIDDNLDILTLLSDSLSEYNVATATNAAEGLEILRHRSVDLVITDVMMPGVDGMTLTRQIKGDKHTMHIPLIILSARNTSAERVEGLASGADAYVGKPFQLCYLRAVIVRLLENRRKLKEYYNSSASAFEYADGKLVDRESKAFVEKIVDFIDSNIDDSELSTEQLADHMQMSVRNLYRRFKDLELASPNDFIKTHRIAFAAKLLVTTSLTVQEIIYRSGFNNRSHFYREFDKQYGMTPKDYRASNRGNAPQDNPLNAAAPPAEG